MPTLNRPGNSTLRLLLALLLAGSMWFYVQHVLIPHQQSEAVLYGIPRGNLSDLYPRWLGARELLLHGRDPYSAEVTREIQGGYYGRPLDPARPHDPRDEQGFAYPAYVVFLLAPTVTLPFAMVQAGFRWLLAGLTGASVLFWLRTLRWKVSAETAAILIVLTLGSFPVLQGIKLQQLSLLVAGLIALSAMLLVEGYLLSAGVLLALATIKPQLALPISAWFLLWALSDWTRRRRFWWGFAGTIAALAGGAEYLLPGWVGRFREAVVAYRRYNQGADSVLDSLITPQWGRWLAIAIAVVLAVVAWQRRRALAGSGTHNHITVLILAATVVVIPKASPYNQVLLLPGILLVLQQGRELWGRGLGRRVMVAICGSALLWPWLAAVALIVASVFLPGESLQKVWALPLYTSMVIPVVVLGLVTAGFGDLAGPT
ncbi:MAG: glycosyltransferase family 87 protein [Terriglobales bacterium]